MLFKLNSSNQIRQTIRSGRFLLFLLFVLPLAISAQTASVAEEMSRDENGKYIHYEVVDQNPAPVDSLRYRAARFFKKKKFKDLLEKGEQLQVQGKFIINKTAFVLSHPSGEIQFQFIFETKAGKYRFWLSNYLFIPYSRDRYGNFVATTTKGSPLENKPGKLNAAEWASYVEAAHQQSICLATEFKRYLENAPLVPAATEKKKVISTKSW